MRHFQNIGAFIILANIYLSSNSVAYATDFTSLPADSLYWKSSTTSDIFKGKRIFITWRGYVNGTLSGRMTIRLPATATTLDQGDVILSYGDSYICSDSEELVSVQWRTASDGKIEEGPIRNQKWSVSTDKRALFMPNLTETLKNASSIKGVSVGLKKEIFHNIYGYPLSISDFFHEVTIKTILDMRITDKCGTATDIYFRSEGAPKIIKGESQ